LLTPSTLEMIGRTLALRDEYVAIVSTDGLIPAQSVDVLTRQADPMRLQGLLQHSARL